MLKKSVHIGMAAVLCSLASLDMKAQVTNGAELIPIHIPYSTCNIVKLSDNGLWAVASGVDSGNSTVNAYPYLINAQTGELTQLWEGDDYSGYAANDVTDDGNTIVGSTSSGPAYYSVEAQEWIALPMSDADLAGSAIVVTPDGKYIAGYGSEGESYTEYSETVLLWELQSDGTYRQVDVQSELSNFPVRDRTGSLTGLVRVTDMSADGNLIVGAMNFIFPQDACSYIYNRTTGETIYPDDHLYDDYGFLTSTYIETPHVSNDGTYLTGGAYIVDSSSEYWSAFRYNIAEDDFELYNSSSEECDRSGWAVTNSGVVFASSPAVNALRYVYIRMGSIWYELEDVLSERYNIDYASTTGVDYTGLIVGVSDDEKVIAGMGIASGEAYIVRLPETITEAASDIDPFGVPTIYPADGSEFVHFSTGTITFNQAVSLVSATAQAQMYNSGGTLERSLTITANSDGASFTFGGRKSQLTAGETYTIKFPAGTFMLTADNSITNKEISVQYIGREDTPTQALAIAPADGASVSEISTSQPVQIAFDLASLQVATDDDGEAAVGYLYEADGESPLCELTISVSANIATLMPALTRYLREGLEYKVVLPANSITDIMGDCGNEEITINYIGAYVQELSPNSDLFFDDFDDPSVSMATYLLYEGDHNTPSTVAEGWGFDADNNPWNFTIRSTDSSSDYCAASHSMYSPAGTSDDWMSLPQLIIENDEYYLSFNAQSYLFGKQDVLKVVVLEAEEGYSTFTSDLYERFTNEGTVILEETLTPGTSEETLEDDWQSFELSLADYAGKSIYIAFVNQNYDQSAIFVDSIRVYYKGDFLLNSTTATYVVNQSSVTVSAQLRINGDSIYNDLTATLTDATGNEVSTYSATGLGLTSESSAYTFEFPDELPLTVGEENSYTISIDFDGSVYSVSGVVKNLAFETTKRVVVEKATGQGCGYCPLGIIAFENIESLFGDLFVPVVVHSTLMGADPYAMDTYVSALGVSALPTAIINRIDTLYTTSAYINSDADTGESYYTANSPSGNETWLDIVQREFTQNPIADADLYITKADLESSTGQINIEGNVNYAINKTSLNNSILFVVTENGLSGIQHNYLYTLSDPYVGEWGSGGIYGYSYASCTYDNVARQVIDNSYAGISGLVPVQVTAGEPTTFSLQRTASQSVSNWSNAELVAMLIDATTGLVVNSVKVPFTIDGISGISTVGAAAGSLDVQAADGQVMVGTDSYAKVSVFDTSGRLVAMSEGAGTVAVSVNSGKGIFIVKVATDGGSVVKKVVMK